MIADVDDDGGVMKTTETLKGGVALTESIDFSPEAGAGAGIGVVFAPEAAEKQERKPKSTAWLATLW